jgi:hypothetical protein
MRCRATRDGDHRDQPCRDDCGMSERAFTGFQSRFRRASPRSGELINRLRDDYEHVEARALGQTNENPPGDPMRGFRLFAVLVNERQFTDATDILGLDDEMTKLLVATRDYLVKSWSELVASQARKRMSRSPWNFVTAVL